MKKTGIIGLLATVITVAMLLTSCMGGGSVSSVGKYLNEDYDPSASVYASATQISELDGYLKVASNEEFVVFASIDPTALSYKVFSFRTGTIITKIAETGTVCTFNLVDGTSAFVVTKVQSDLTTAEVLKTTHVLYDGTGAAVATIEEDVAPDAPELFGDLVIYDHVAYSVSNDGALTKELDVPEYLALGACDTWNDDYFYSMSVDSIRVYDRSFNGTTVWTAPSYAEETEFYVLNNGDVLIQYSYEMDHDSSDYDYYMDDNNDGITEKMDLVTLVLSAKDGSVKDVNMEYIVRHILVSNKLYDENDDNNIFNDKFDNIAMVYPIVDEKIDISMANADYMLMSNKGKIGKSLKMVDNQIASIPEKIGDDLYRVSTLYGEALINGNGKILQQMNNSLSIVGGYFIGNRAIYDLELNEVYDLKENKATVIKTLDNTVFVRAEEDTKYTIIALCGGEQKTVYTYDSAAENNLTFEFVEEADCYVIHNTQSGDYQYYNAEGTLLVTTTTKLTALDSSAEYKSMIFWNLDSAAPTYYIVKS